MNDKPQWLRNVESVRAAPRKVYKRITFNNVHDRAIKVTFKIEVKNYQTNIDLILKASYALKNPENWQFYEIQG